MPTLTGESLSASSLKRKRPPSLDVSNILREIQTDGPEARNDGVASFAGVGVGVFSRKGQKKFMEDSHTIVSFAPSDSASNRGFFGVYDGHGGRKAVEFVTENLHSNVLEMMNNLTGKKEEAVRAAYLKTDQDFLKKGLSSGTCCVTALIEGPEIVVSNLGDCRAVLSRGGIAEALTKDHRAEDEDERTRIQDEGGYVEFHRGAWRVHGVLSVSRSIGDGHLKDWVLAEPETKILQITPDMEFLLLASDGLWEHVGNQEAVDLVKRLISGERRNSESFSGKCPKENDNHLSPSMQRRVSPAKRKNSGSSSGNCLEENVNFGDIVCVNLSPSMHRRFSPAKPLKAVTYQSSSRKGSEIESPPLKSRRISLVKRINTKENDGCDGKSPESGRLVGACKELAILAESRGGLDDVTVMIVDLNYFRVTDKLSVCSKKS